MAKDVARLREKALRLGRSAIEDWEAKRFIRVAFSAGRAETILFRLICGDPHDLGLCSAFGEIASLHSAVYGKPRVRSLVYAPIVMARAALWARDRADPSAGDPRNVLWAVHEPMPETAFPQFDGSVRRLAPETLMIAAADARLRLAYLLATYPPRGDKNAMTPEQLNRTLSSREKFFRSDEELVYHFHAASCVQLDATAEARTLAQEAVDAYQAIAAELGPRYEQDAARAEERLHAIQRKLPLLDQTGE